MKRILSLVSFLLVMTLLLTVGCSSRLESHTETKANLSCGYLFCIGAMLGEYNSSSKPVYKYWYKRADGGILAGTISSSDRVVIVVYEDDKTTPKVELFKNGIAAKNYMYEEINKKVYYGKTEYRFTIPSGSFVNTYDFQGIAEKNSK